MKARVNREETAWKDLPKLIQQRVASYIFKSAIKSNVAVILFRCEKHHWHKDKMRSLFYEIVGLYRMRFFGKPIKDTELIDRYEKMLGIDFDILDEAVEVVT